MVDQPPNARTSRTRFGDSPADGLPGSDRASPTPVRIAAFRQGLRSVNGRVRQGEVFLVMNRTRPVAMYGPSSWARYFGSLEDVTLMDVRNSAASVLARASTTPLRVMEYGQCAGVLCPLDCRPSMAGTKFDKECTVNEQDAELFPASPICPMTVLTIWNEAGGATNKRNGSPRPPSPKSRLRTKPRGPRLNPLPADSN